MLSPRGVRSAKFFYTLIKDEIQFTDAFNKALVGKLQERQQKEFLRLQINAGEGCQGYTYKFKFDNNLNADDFVSVGEGKRVLFACSEQELNLVRGSMLDYAREMMREAFYVKENPNAEISCSCKTSFSPKDFLL